jgi:aminopeptidase N
MWLAQMQEGKNYLDKVEALESLAPRWKKEAGYDNALQQLLTDRYYGTRKAALKQLKRGSIKASPASLSLIEKMAATETDLPTRAMALDVLSLQCNAAYETAFTKALHDSSYSVAGAALESLARLDANKAIAAAKAQEQDAKGRLKAALQIVDYLKKDTAQASTVLADFKKMAFFEKLQAANGMLYYANRLTDVSNFKKAAGSAIEVYKMLRMDFQGWQTNMLSTLRWMIAVRQQALSSNPNNTLLQEQLKYLQDKTGL